MILGQKCLACHGEGGSADDGMNYILDRNRLVKRQKVLAGRSADSKLFQQVKTGTMPKEDEPISAAELDDEDGRSYHGKAAHFLFCDGHSKLIRGNETLGEF